VPTSHSITILDRGREGWQVVFGIYVLSKDSTHPICRERQRERDETKKEYRKGGGDYLKSMREIDKASERATKNRESETFRKGKRVRERLRDRVREREKVKERQRKREEEKGRERDGP